VALSAGERVRYDRHLALPEIGAAGQERLKAARVLVVGAGGLGSPAALYLAAAGVGTLGIVDFDRVELSNLQRQVLFESADVGRLKVEAARDRLLALNPGITVVTHAVTLQAHNAREVMETYDIVLDGTDRLSARYLINDACVLLGKPLVMAAIHRFEGQAMTYVPGQGPCYRCLFPEAREGVAASCADAGVLGVLPGVLGAIQATEAIKIATRSGEPLVGRLLIYDALDLRFSELPVSRRVDCAVCGDQPTIAALQDAGELCESDTLQSVHRLSATALRDMMACDRASGPQLVLVDVREPREFSVRHLEGSRNIPLAELECRLAELPGEGAPVFLCRSGGRSLAACAIAARAGVAAPAHLEGGLLAWAAEVDSGFEVASV
jgi:sulfur-carrier protein adenylyltransferase/sulfurtransferase